VVEGGEGGVGAGAEGVVIEDLEGGGGGVEASEKGGEGGIGQVREIVGTDADTAGIGGDIDHAKAKLTVETAEQSGLHALFQFLQGRFQEGIALHGLGYIRGYGMG